MKIPKLWIDFVLEIPTALSLPGATAIVAVIGRFGSNDLVYFVIALK